MSALPMAKYGLDSLYLFPYYQSQDDYQKATGNAAPAFNPNRQPKYWFDPAAASSVKRTVVYNQTLSVADNGAPLVGTDGKPMLDLLALQKDEASTVNIPPKGPGVANVAGASAPEVQPPLRALEACEQLDFGFGNTVYVHNRNYPFDNTGVFTFDDRLLLQAIARKLGV